MNRNASETTFVHIFQKKIAKESPFQQHINIKAVSERQ